MDERSTDPLLDELREPLARWELGDLEPWAVPALALAALERGCTLPEVAVLAGLRDPLRAEVEAELRGLLKRLGWSRPTHEQAVKTVADHVAAQIVEGSIAVSDGAYELCWLAHVVDSGGPIETQLRVFVGLDSEWDQKPQRPAIEAAIVDAARELLATGGIHLDA